MKFGELFPIYYYVILSAFVLFYSIPLFYIKKINLYPKINQIIGLPLLAFFITFYIGLRDPFGSSNFYGDTLNYTMFYINLADSEFGFNLLMRFCKNFLLLNVTGFYLVCSFIYIGFHYLALRRWFSKDVFFPFIILITTMFFFSFGINGLRTGLGFSLFFYALSCEKMLLKILFMFISVSMHSSLLLPVMGYLLAQTKWISIKNLIKIWFFAIIIAFLVGKQIMSLAESYFAFIFSDDDRTGSYLSAENTSSTFRIDFIIYSAVPIFVGYYFIYKRKFYDRFYTVIFKTYIIVNTFWIFIIYANYTNRFACLSWFLIPLILSFPLFKDKELIKNQPRFLLKIIYIQLAFTIFMFLKDYVKVI